MKFLKSSAAVLSVLGLVACGGSSSSGGGVPDPMDPTPPTGDPDQNPIDPNLSLEISADDVYDPTLGIIGLNHCSAPYYETVSGVYEGQITVFDGNRRSCEWDVSIRVARFYREGIAPRSQCFLEVSMSANDRNPDADNTMPVGDNLICLSGDVVGDIKGPLEEPELSTLNFPIEEEFNFDESVQLTNGSGVLVATYPSGQATTSSSVVGLLNLVFDGSGALTLKETTLLDPIWTANISKVKSDLDP